MIARQLADESDTEALGAQLADAWLTFNQGLVIYLEGNLGLGKTTLCRGLIRHLGHKGAVKSPTYTLVEPYELSNKLIYHFDLYRLAHSEELEYLGVRDYFLNDSLCLIEWPQRGKPLLPAADVVIELDVAGAGRAAALLAESEKGQAFLTCL